MAGGLASVGAAGMRPCPMDSSRAGALKLLDVNMFGWPAHTGRPAVATAAECCYACADTPGCNVWNFCPLKGGCGTGCTAAKFGPTGTQQQARTSYVRPSLPLRNQLVLQPRRPCCSTRCTSTVLPLRAGSRRQICTYCSALSACECGSHWRGDEACSH